MKSARGQLCQHDAFTSRRTVTSTDDGDDDNDDVNDDANDEGACLRVEDIVHLLMCYTCGDAPLKTPVGRCAGHEHHPVCADCRRRSGARCKCGAPTDSAGGAGDEALDAVARELPAAACAAMRRLVLQDPEAQVNKLEDVRRRELETVSRQGQLQGYEPRNLYPSPPSTSNPSPRAAIARRASLGSLAGNITYSPAPCPFPCSRSVTGSSLFSHFDFLHPGVPTVDLRVGQELRLAVRPAELQAIGRRCQALCMLHLDEAQGGEQSQRMRGRAHRTSSCHSMAENRLCPAAVVAGVLGRRRRPRKDEDGEGDDGGWMAVWATALYRLPGLVCTIAADDRRDDGSRPLYSWSYTGPAASMHECVRPSSAVAHGCLLLSLSRRQHQARPFDVRVSFLLDPDQEHAV